MTLPVVVSCGEPAGIGPELIVKARQILGADLPFAWIGDPRHLPRGTHWTAVPNPAAALTVPADQLPVLVQEFPAPAMPGRPDPANAPGVVAAITHGVALVQGGQAAALCTLPISKQTLYSGADFAFPGHTEYLAHLAGGAEVVMCLASDLLRVVPATIHIPLAEVPQALTPARLEQVIRITHASMQRDFGIVQPRIAVAGLNPHAGEGGTMGREEVEWIAPLIARLAAAGLGVTGPHPADTLFHARARAGYDVAVCCYHDQALIPIKTLAFDEGVNVTLGLPFVRTSPDHGTAFDIAGQGIARPDSVVAALRLAAQMAAARVPH